jgi:amino acid permease
MPRAVNTTTWVLIGSYLTVLIVLALTLPLGEADLLGSPFASVFELAGIKSGALIVNIIVLTSALSSGNYFVYASTRYLWSMSQYGQAPKFLSKVNKRKVPFAALVLCMIFAAFSIVASFVAEDTVYLFLMCLIGSANVLWYGTICTCQFLFRRRYVRDGGDVKDLPYKTPLFPLVPVLGVLLYLGVFVGMIMDPTQTMSLAVSVPAYIILFVGYTIYEKVRKNKNADGKENETAN